MEKEKIEEKQQGVKLNDFDEMLVLVGSWGRFQIILTLLFFPFNLFLGYVYLSSVLINFTPPHWCKVPALMNVSLEERMRLAIPLEADSSFSKCSMYAPDWNKVLEDGITEPDSSWPKVSCQDGWEYDLENYHRSVSSDFDWVCHDEWIPTLSQALFFIGAIPGTLIFGYLSDKFGRVPVILMSNVLAMVTGLCTPFVTGMASYLLIRFLTGLSFNCFYTVMYILTLEYVDESKRTFVGNIGLALILTVSGVYQPWLIKGLGDWKPFSWILYSQMIVVLCVPWVMPESSRWLMSQGKTEKAVKIMRNIAKINKREVSEETFSAFHDLCEAERKKTESSNTSLVDLVRHPVVRKNTILVTILFMLMSLVFDASVRNIENLNFSIYMSFMVSTALELPADLLSIVGLTHLGRRWSASLSLALTGICMLITIPLADYPTAANFFALTGRFWATYGMNTGLQYTVEVMPTSLRGTGTALASIMSMVSQIASPYIVYSSVIHPAMPFILIGVLGVLGSFPVLFLPETAGVTLPDTVEEAKTYGIHDNIFWIPLMSEKKRFKNNSADKAMDEQTEGSTQNMAFTPE